MLPLIANFPYFATGFKSVFFSDISGMKDKRKTEKTFSVVSQTEKQQFSIIRIRT